MLHHRSFSRMLLPMTLLLLIAAGPATRPDGSDIDWNHARALLQRLQHGEKLSAEDQAFLNHARQVRAQLRAAGIDPEPGRTRPPGAAPAGGHESLGLVPLTDMAGEQKYKGMDGGLYGGGKNVPPDAQEKLALAAAAQVQPLNADGKPAPDGKIVMLSIGMSNTTMEFSRFKQIADDDPAKSPKLVIVDGAQGGMDAQAWSGLPSPRPQAKARDSKRVWQTADDRLHASGVTPQQVQVVWILQALIQPGAIGEFPKHADELKQHVELILQQAKQRYPNLRLAYLSNRIYAGYAVTQLNPEPYSYESAFAVRSVIEDQMKGDASLNADPSHGDVKAPVVLWGPYLWADGTKGRSAGDLVWKREDFAGDGTHPAASARQKVADLLLTFFKTDPTTKSWFVAPAPPGQQR